MGDYPEHEKLAAISDKSQVIGEFIEEFLPSKGVYLAERHPHGSESALYPTLKRTTALLAEFFDIDEDKIEAEKRAMLDALRGGA